MSQHDFDIDNATAAAARVDINLALKALGSLSSGTAAPATTYANMMWYDTATNWLFVRNEANSAWVRFAYINQATNLISLVDNTNIVNTAGTQVGLLGDQTTATWQAGTGTTQSLVSPANVKSAILALAAPVNTTTVLAATAGLSVGAVGSYALMRQTVTSTVQSAGATRAGSGLYYTSCEGNGSTTTAGGTWRIVGAISSGVATTTNSSVWVRIS